MKFFKFIPWLWKSLDPIDRGVWFFLSFTGFSTVLLYMFGQAAIMPIIIVFSAIVILVVAMVIGTILSERWERYTREQELEANEILARLKGSRQD